MKVADLTIQDWQRLLDAYKADPSNHTFADKAPCAIRIENTPFTTARYFGGMKYNGAAYTYLEPREPAQPDNPDGTPYVAWLMVRRDFLEWATLHLKKGGAE